MRAAASSFAVLTGALLLAACASAQSLSGVTIGAPAAGGGGGGGAGGSITESIDATSFTATATEGNTLTCTHWPCPVFFDATGTTASGITDPLHEAWYEWSFGDSSAGTVDRGGRTFSLNEGVSPIAFHSYASSAWNDTCGASACTQHTVTLTVTIESGGAQVTETATLTVNEISPRVLFATTDTTCYCDEATCTDDAGCPTGAANGGDASTTLGTAEGACNTAGTQMCLFEGGVTFSGGSSVTYGTNKVTLGSYGTGKAIFQHSYTTTNPFKVNDTCAGIAVWNVQIDATGTAEAGAVFDNNNSGGNKLGKCLLVHDVDMGTGNNRPHNLTNFWSDAATATDEHEQLYFYDFVSTENGTSSATGPVHALSCDRCALVAGEVGNTQGTVEHNIRIPQAVRLVIDTMKLSDAPHAKSLLTWRNHVDTGYARNQYMATTRNAFIMGSDSGGTPAVPLELCGSNNLPTDLREFEHSWILRNVFYDGGTTDQNPMSRTKAGASICRDKTIAQNFFNFSGTEDGAASTQVGFELDSGIGTDIRCRGNVGVTTDAGRSANNIICDVGSLAGEDACENNLLYGKSGTNSNICGSSVTESADNIAVSSDPFNVVAGDPASGTSTDWDDLQITTASAALDVGALDHLNTDAAGQARPVGTTDAGVFEKQ
jgi:hypothetical protein